MPLTLAKMTSNTASVTFIYGDDPVTVVYYPSRVTEKTLAQLQFFISASEDTLGQSFETLNEILAGKAITSDRLTDQQRSTGLVKSWDVYEDDAQSQMFPIDPSRFSDLPFDFRIKVLGAIIGDVRPEAIAATK